jgi:hypothetical protein
MRNREFKTPSRTSPNDSSRACLCPDNTYNRKCCDGSLQAQGIGSIYNTPYLLTEDGYALVQEDFVKIGI